MSKREPGFYWVKWAGEWQPAKYSNGWHRIHEIEPDSWQEGHYDSPLKDSDLDEIDERPIQRTPT